MAGLAAGLWTEVDFDKSLEIDKSFEPAITDEKREALYAGWREAIERSVGWRKQA